MNRYTFNNTAFGAGDCAEYEGNIYKIVAVSFSEGLFGIDVCDDIDNLTWVRCESVNLVKPEILQFKRGAE